MVILEESRTLRRRGIKNARLCRFFTWFWFHRENRSTQWKTTVVEILGPSTFRVNKGGSRQTVWLRAPGCMGYEYPRQIWIALGEWLRRYRWFLHWNRKRCPKCGHDVFEEKHRAGIDSYYGPTCELIECCARCKADVYEFMYGYSTDFSTDRWIDLELKLFGSIKEIPDKLAG